MATDTSVRELCSNLRGLAISNPVRSVVATSRARMSGKSMRIAACNFTQAPEILAILNEAIINSTALYDYKPRTMAAMEEWFEAKKKRD